MKAKRKAQLTREVTDLRRRVPALQRLAAGRKSRGKAAQALAEMARELAGTLDLGQATRVVVSTVLRLFRVRFSVLYGFGEMSGLLACIAAAGEGNGSKWVGQTLAGGEGVTGLPLELEEGRAMGFPDALADPRLRLPEGLRERLSAEGCHSLAAVPLIAREKKLGLLLLADRRGRVFTEGDLRLLSTVADQAALTLENARLYQQTQRALRWTETLLAVSQAVGSTLDLTEAMRRVAREGARAVGADMAGAYLVDPDQEFLRPIAGYHVPTHLLDMFLALPIPLRGNPFLEEAWSQRCPVLSRDAEADPRIDREIFRRFPHRSVLFFPMIVRDEPIGGLFLIWWEEKHRFTPEDLRLIEGISRQAAMAISNARLFAAREEEVEISGTLLRLAQAVEGLQDLDPLLETVTEAAPQLLGLTRCGLFLFDSAEGTLVPTKAWGFAEAEIPAFLALKGAPNIPAVARAAESLEPMVVAPATLDTWIPEDVANALNIRSMLVVPLVSRGRLMGIIALDSPGVAQTFTPKQIAIARGIAGHAAVAIDNARLYGEARNALADLKAAQEELIRGETLRATGELAAGIAHHLNNLLTIILWGVQLLLKEIRAPSIRRELKLVEQATSDSVLVVRRVLRFGRAKPEAQMVPVDLNTIAEDALELARALWQAQLPGIRIEVSFVSGEIPMVTGDSSSLREVLMNLLLNAGDALPEDGRVSVKTWSLGHWVYCAVTDRGVGMSDEVRRRSPEPFFTTKGPKRTGLGLSVTYAIVRRHGGKIEIESAEGRGTTVTIRLPAAPAATSSSSRNR